MAQRRSISGRRPTLAHSERVFGGWSLWSWSIFDLREQTSIYYIACLYTNGDSHDSFFVFDRLFGKTFSTEWWLTRHSILTVGNSLSRFPHPSNLSWLRCCLLNACFGKKNPVKSSRQPMTNRHMHIDDSNLQLPS